MASASLELPKGIKTKTSNSPEISKYYNEAGTPYTSTAQVLSEVTVRYIGQVFNVDKVEYCFEKGTGNGDLVIKKPDLSGHQPISEKGEAEGYAGLDASKNLPIENHNIGGVVLNAPTKQNILDADIIPSLDSSGDKTLVQRTFSHLRTYLRATFDSLYMMLTGNQSVDGVKTFLKSPIVPTPTTDMEVVNKIYVDGLSQSDDSKLDKGMFMGTADDLVRGIDNRLMKGNTFMGTADDLVRDIDNRLMKGNTFMGTTDDLMESINHRLMQGNYWGSADDLNESIEYRLMKGNYWGSADDLAESIDHRLMKGNFMGDASDLMESINHRLMQGNYMGSADDLNESINHRLMQGNYWGSADDLNESIEYRLMKGNFWGTADDLSQSIDDRLMKGNFWGTADDLVALIEGHGSGDDMPDNTKLDKDGYDGTAYQLDSDIRDRLEKDGYEGTAYQLDRDIRDRLEKDGYDGTAYQLDSDIRDRLEKGSYMGNASDLELAIENKADKVDIQPIKSTSTHTLLSTDVNTVIPCDNMECVFTVDLESIARIGDTIEIDYQGDGTCEVVSGTMTLLYNENVTLFLDGKFSRVAIQKVSATECRVFGELKPIEL